MDHFSSSGTSVDDALPCLLVVGPVFPRVTLPVSVSCPGGPLSAHISEMQPRWGAASGRRCWWESAAAPVGRPPSLWRGPSPPLLGARSHMACLQGLRLLCLCYVPGMCCPWLCSWRSARCTHRLTRHTHRMISSGGGSERFLFQDLFIFSNYRRPKRPSVYVG